MFAEGTNFTLEIGPNIVALVALFIPLLMVLAQSWIVYRNRAIGKDVAETKIKVVEVADQVKTLNDLTVGQLADATESRRIKDIPKDDRTKAEASHLLAVPEPPSTEKTKTKTPKE
jgi:hypothetical protein